MSPRHAPTPWCTLAAFRPVRLPARFPCRSTSGMPARSRAPAYPSTSASSPTTSTPATRTYQDPVTGFTTNPQTSFEQQALSAKANIHFGESTLLEIIGSFSTFDGAFATDSDQSPYSVQLVDGIQDGRCDDLGSPPFGHGGIVRLDAGCVLVRRRVHQLAAGVHPGLRADGAAGQWPQHHQLRKTSRASRTVSGT